MATGVVGGQPVCLTETYKIDPTGELCTGRRLWLVVFPRVRLSRTKNNV